jgi:hypothetical protein
MLIPDLKYKANCGKKSLTSEKITFKQYTSPIGKGLV